MTSTPTRTRADAWLVLDAPELLAVFNQAGVLDPVDVHAATTVADLLGERDESVVLAAALTVRGTRFGHVCIDLSTVRESVSIDGVPTDVVDALPWPDPEPWIAAVADSPLTGDGSPNLPLVLRDGLLYLERYWRYESSVAEQLMARANAAPLEVEGLTGPIRRLFPGEARRQRLAAALGATSHLTVIAGGPGTGKTYTVARILGLLVEQADATGSRSPFIAVAAPTGKAAARLTEQIRAFAETGDITPRTREQVLELEASTLHRLLGWHPGRGRFQHSADNPLPHDTVIVDEMSMVSLPMTAKLLDAVHPDARLILVGDPDQLVSIEAGTVLGDLVGPAREQLLMSADTTRRLTSITGDEPPDSSDHSTGLGDQAVTLDTAFRFGEASPIAELAAAIRAGDGDLAVERLSSGAEGLSWHETSGEPRDQIDGLADRLVAHAQELIALGEAGDAEGALAEMERLALLCAHRRGEHGVEHWVPLIEGRARTGSWERWYPGRPVMITTNDYRLGVFNGDIGVTVRDNDRLAVAFRGPEGVMLIGPAQLPSTETVHAMTIHKSQGSQFEQVVVMIPGEESRLLARELLYTAITRARNRVTLVGTESAIRSAIDRRVTRSSGLRDKLWDTSSPHRHNPKASGR